MPESAILLCEMALQKIKLGSGLIKKIRPKSRSFATLATRWRLPRA
jgi:hypothetical protein